jgi:membrane fusion protein, copper/silver efflux system
MKKINSKGLARFFQNGSMRYIVFLLVGLFLGWMFFHSSGNSEKLTTQVDSKKKQIWTCAMHPQIHLDHPGKCPICGMELIPLHNVGDTSSITNADMKMDPNSITLSDEAVALANVQTTIVSMEHPQKDVRLFGKVKPNERFLQSQAAYVGGRIEKLFVNSIGDRVGKGQALAVIYSPELYTAEQELVEALKFGEPQQRTYMVNAAKEKLRLWNLTSGQIANIIRTRTASPMVQLKSNTSGTVISRSVSQGDYVNQGAVLLQIANLSKVWVVFQAYEEDLPFLRRGQRISFTSQAAPGKTFYGIISFIEPVIDPITRTAGVRVEMPNSGGLLKPEMFVTGDANAFLVQHKNQIVIPQSAVLWTGKRSVVYVKDKRMNQPTFSMRQVLLGPSLASSYVVLSGLSQSEEIVTNGAFAIDASAQLAGKKTMMNQ